MSDSTTGEDLPELPPSTPKPLFVVELGDNGGRFAPTSHAEVREWLNLEATLWNQVFQDYNGIRAAKVATVREAQNALNSARALIDEADPARGQHGHNAAQPLERCKQQIEQAFLNLRLPHSSTALYRRLAALAVQDPIAASFYASVQFPLSTGENARLLPTEVRGWRGYVEGLIDRHELGGETLAKSVLAKQEAFEVIRGKLETLHSEKAVRIGMLDRHFEQTAIAILKTRVAQRESFRLSQTERDEAFKNLNAKHDAEMASIREAFRVGQGMRAPVNYWRTKKSEHGKAVTRFGWAVGVGMVVAAVVLLTVAFWVVGGTDGDKAPAAWKIATFSIVGLFTVWGMRILVRMLLSNLHLRTDAEERAVMVETYLALIEGGQVTEKEGRELILTALFRPASDGIVKDEGMPMNVFELLTRTPRS